MAARNAGQIKALLRNPLKLVCIAGIVAALFVILAMVLFGFVLGRGGPAKGRDSGTTFTRELKDYDLFDAPKRLREAANPAQSKTLDQIEKKLSVLQKQVRTAEEQLSVLKRRRILALADRRFISGYEKAAREGADAFPYSAPLAAAVAEAVIMGDTPLSESALARLKSYAPKLAESRFGLLELGIHVYAGDLATPARAAGVPELLRLLSQVSGEVPAKTLPDPALRDLLADEFLLRALNRDIPGATVRLNDLLSALGPGPADAALVRMGAEFFYDHQNPLRAAELFARLPGEQDIARAADALVLAGEIPGARNIWLALSSDPAGTVPAGNSPVVSTQAGKPQPGDSVSSAIRSRSLYNLAASSAGREEEAAWLEKLFARESGSTRSAGEKAPLRDSTGIFSIIRYTRLLDSSRSIAVLDTETMRQNPLLDLELLLRRLDTLPPTRAAAEVWLLLGRHSEAEDLYEWAAWYFDHQRLYDESSRLCIEASRKGMTGPWLDLHKSLTLIRAGRITEGEKLLKETGGRSAAWQIPANLGRITESRRAFSAALDYYQAAAALLAEQRPPDKPAAAQVQMRLSRCLEALGR
ncbi:MAG: hypothetical protein FWC45_01440, partial [Treponema sp.]|nr:hypothetical protein [Treponema sp.]